MTEIIYRPTWIEINLDAIEYNIQQLQKRLPEKTEIVAVVKANGYGHGDIEVAKAALTAGASKLAVALLGEAIQLRKAGIQAPIIVLGWVDSNFVREAINYSITLTFFQKEWIKEIKQIDFHGKLSLHLKVDTGMGRIGITSKEELNELLAELDDPRLELTGAYTHFATADETNLDYFEQQQVKWEEFEKQIETGSNHIMLHTGNSAASMRFPRKMLHAVRFGISMYGLYPSDAVKQENPIDLQAALSLHSRLIHVKQVPTGSSISYGATYTTEKEEWIGTIPIGYADGFARKLTGSAILIEGKRMPIVGKICMDQCMLDLV